MSEIFKCECCGQLYEHKKDQHGTPGGIALANSHGYVTHICMECVRNRSDRANKVLDRNRTKGKEDTV